MNIFIDLYKATRVVPRTDIRLFLRKRRIFCGENGTRIIMKNSEEDENHDKT